MIFGLTLNCVIVQLSNDKGFGKNIEGTFLDRRPDTLGAFSVVAKFCLKKRKVLLVQLWMYKITAYANELLRGKCVYIKVEILRGSSAHVRTH